MDGYIGQIIMFAANWAPRNWAVCNGQLLAIAQYQALFSILGTTYGGDGRTTFALPDLRGRAALGFGQAPGLRSYPLGLRGGVEQQYIQKSNLPNVTLSIPASENGPDTEDPNGAVPAVGRFYSSTPTTGTQLGNGIPLGGGGQPLNNHAPFQVVNYVICVQGTFPSRP